MESETFGIFRALAIHFRIFRLVFICVIFFLSFVSNHLGTPNLESPS